MVSVYKSMMLVDCTLGYRGGKESTVNDYRSAVEIRFKKSHSSHIILISFVCFLRIYVDFTVLELNM